MKKKVPWGFLAGLSGVITFYLIVAATVVFVILNRIEAETNGTASLFGTWYQTLIFFLAIVFLAGTVVLSVFGVKAKKEKTVFKKEEQPLGGENS